MAGIDNGTIQSSISFQVKQFGSVLRGSGPPVPQAGLVGDLYLDTATFNFYEKRSPDAAGDVDPWGHSLFVVPATYRNQLKWFSTSLPDDSIGITGDYCLSWAGFGNYGLSPVSIYGPKNVAGSWPESGNGPNTAITAVGTGFVPQVGLTDEGSPPGLAYSNSTQLVVVGIIDEYVLAKPVANTGGTPVGMLGLQSTPTPVTIVLNPLYTAEDETLVGGGGGGVPVLSSGQFTLNANATTTVVTTPCLPTSIVLYDPLTQDAANDMATTSYVAGTGSFTVTHANNPRIDRTFGYVVI